MKERAKKRTVRVLYPVCSDLPCPPFTPLIAAPGIYEAEVNQHGAVSVKIGDQLLGVKPGEFEWIDQ